MTRRVPRLASTRNATEFSQGPALLTARYSHCAAEELSSDCAPIRLVRLGRGRVGS